MSNFNNSVDELLEHKKSLYKKMYELEDAINNIKEDLSSTNVEIFSKCNHNWVRDWEADSGCRKICSICNLYANPHCNF